MSNIQTPFDDIHTPHQLPASKFRDFALFSLDGYFFDASQPEHWTQVAKPNGHGVKPTDLARKMSARVQPLGVTVDQTLLWKVINSFKIHGPALDPEINKSASDRAREALAEVQS
jgi:hypothetical protein